MDEAIFSKGTLVYIIGAGPFSGCKGTIRAVDRIEADGQQVVFYLVVLRDEPGRELWLERDAVVAI